jgi:sugar O-acyltransferase (sialic acid O-acetyltransferase NeuD family)
MTPLLIVGGGGHAKVLIDIITSQNKYNISGYVDIIDRGILLGCQYLGDDDHVLEGFISSIPHSKAALGLGIVGPNPRRVELFKRLRRLGYELPAIISGYARIAMETFVGDGTVICHNAVLQVCATVGNASILNTNCIVEHDCRVGNFVHIAPGAVLCGDVEVGDESVIGAGAVVVPGRKIAAECFVGAGAVVTEDLVEAGLYVGIPARKIK